MATPDVWGGARPTRQPGALGAPEPTQDRGAHETGGAEHEDGRLGGGGRRCEVPGGYHVVWEVASPHIKVKREAASGQGEGARAEVGVIPPGLCSLRQRRYRSGKVWRLELPLRDIPAEGLPLVRPAQDVDGSIEGWRKPAE